ncbi:MAG: putative Ig domain-containing protein [Bacteroidota bacterium]
MYGLINFNFSQVQTKKGGIYFRVDDNQAINKWKDYAQVFDRYGYKFCFALNLGMLSSETDYIKMIRDFQSSGHELQDHTPNHRTMFFTHPDAKSFVNNPVVDHVNGDTVCFKISSIDTSKQYGSGFANISGNVVLSQAVGGFKLFGLRTVYSRIFFPSLNLLCGFSKAFALNGQDIDTLIITSQWQEFISLSAMNNVEYKIISSYDIEIPDGALNLLARRTLELITANNITRPYTWIQPGGLFTQLSRKQIKRVYGDVFGYTSAGVAKDPVLKAFNIFDPDNDNRFGMDWGDFQDYKQSLTVLKKVIVDGIAKHYVLGGSNHFLIEVGDWNFYLQHLDSLLQWCSQKNILIKTQNEWAHRLYDLKTNPYENIMPPLHVDLNDDRIPDGFYYQTGYTLGVIDSTDGVEVDRGYSLSISKNGVIGEISKLAGLEKGELDFSIWTKGSPGNAVQVKFTFPENGMSTIFSFPAESNNWKKYSLAQSTSGVTTLHVPDSISLVNILISCPTYKNGPVKISGMELRKKIEEKLKIVSIPVQRVDLGKRYEYRVEYYNQNPADAVTITPEILPSWLSLSNDNILSGIAPIKTGEYPVTISIKNSAGDTDTQRFNIYTKNLSRLSINTSYINVGNVEYNFRKDTMLLITNLGEDSLKIISIMFDSAYISCAIPYMIPPGKVEYIHVGIHPPTVGKFEKNIVIRTEQESELADTINIEGYVDTISWLKDRFGIPSEFKLYQNFPNPFNHRTHAFFAIKEGSIVTITVYDVLGRLVKNIFTNAAFNQGIYSLQWDGTDNHSILVNSGVYFLQFTALSTSSSEKYRSSIKMVLMK